MALTPDFATEHYSKFLNSYPYFLVIRFGKLSKNPSTSDYVEQSAYKLVRQLSSLPLHVKLWPELLRDTSKETCQTSEVHRACLYLIGVSSKESMENISSENFNNLKNAIDDWNSATKSDKQVIAETDDTLSISIIDLTNNAAERPNAFASLQALEPDINNETSSKSHTLPSKGAKTSLIHHDRTASGEETCEEQVTSNMTAKHPKLRTATDVYNRFLWDPSLHADDILIGWEDRHSGIWATGLGSWARESTAENFVPMHRIRFFARKSTGEVLWDRRKRIDRVFHTT